MASCALGLPRQRGSRLARPTRRIEVRTLAGSGLDAAGACGQFRRGLARPRCRIIVNLHSALAYTSTHVAPAGPPALLLNRRVLPRWCLLMLVRTIVYNAALMTESVSCFTSSAFGKAGELPSSKSSALAVSSPSVAATVYGTTRAAASCGTSCAAGMTSLATRTRSYC